ncbi:hypothetical protein L9F63_014181, partial [Diploptera punctata]
NEMRQKYNFYCWQRDYHSMNCNDIGWLNLGHHHQQGCQRMTDMSQFSKKGQSNQQAKWSKHLCFSVSELVVGGNTIMSWNLTEDGSNILLLKPKNCELKEYSK